MFWMVITIIIVLQAVLTTKKVLYKPEVCKRTAGNIITCAETISARLSCTIKAMQHRNKGLTISTERFFTSSHIREIPKIILANKKLIEKIPRIHLTF